VTVIRELDVSLVDVSHIRECGGEGIRINRLRRTFDVLRMPRRSRSNEHQVTRKALR
jgi:hypothetical protein